MEVVVRQPLGRDVGEPSVVLGEAHASGCVPVIVIFARQSDVEWKMGLHSSMFIEEEVDMSSVGRACKYPKQRRGGASGIVVEFVCSCCRTGIVRAGRPLLWLGRRIAVLT